MASCWQIDHLKSFTVCRTFLLHFDYYFLIMKFFSVFKKKPQHGQSGADVPTSSRSSPDPFDSEVLFQGKDPIIAE